MSTSGSIKQYVERYDEEVRSQQITVKWWAVGIGCAVLVFMGLFLFAALHQVTLLDLENAPATVAIIVAPTASITTVTVMLFIGAFRKFEDKDPETAADVLKDILAAINRIGGSGGGAP